MNIASKLINSKKFLGFLYVAISAVCFSSKGVIIKLAYSENIDALSLLTFRMLFAFPFFIAFGVFTKNQSKSVATNRDYALTIFLGLIGYYLSSLLDFYGLEYVSAGMERLILFMYPTLVAILGLILFNRKISKPIVLSLMLTYTGILLVVFYDISVNGLESLPGVLFIALSAFTFAIYLVYSNDLVHKFGSSALYTSFVMSASALGVFAHYLFTHSFSISALSNYSTNVYIYSVVLALFATVLPSYLMTDGIKKIGAGNTSITSTLGPVWTIILAYFILGEEINFSQIVGTALVVAGVLVAAKNKKS